MMKKLKSIRQIPQAQQEVWEWKQTLYKEIKDMSMTDGLNYLLKKGQEVNVSKRRVH